MRKRGLCCRPVSVRLSVRHVVGLYPHGEDIVKLLVPPSNNTTLGFFNPNSKGTPSAGAQGGWEILAIFD